MHIIHYPHPTLRHRSKPLKRVDKSLREMVREMFDLMYEAKGIGLAANQVDLPFRLFVSNVEGDPAAADQEQVFLNPVLSRAKGTEEAEEGCLSLPDLHADIKRPKKIIVSAFNLEGEPIEGELSGLPGRVVQHEVDHLDGVLFIDRLSATGELSVRDALDEMEVRFQQGRELGEIPDNGQIAARLAELESRYC